jgi:hypothetical protein
MLIVYLFIIVAVITSSILLQEVNRRKHLDVKTFHMTEISYLQLYKNVLLRILQMEKDLKGFETTISGYVKGQNQTGPFLVTSQTVNISNELKEIHSKLDQLIGTYAVGEISLNNMSFQVDLLDHRLSSVAHLMAA